MKLAIALPLNYDKEYSQFWDSFVIMQKPSFDYYRPQFPAHTHIDAVRNGLVKMALENNNSHMLMMDTDQTYPPDVINLLLGTMGRRDCLMVGTVIYRRYIPFDPLVFLRDGNGLYKMSDEEIYAEEDLEVDATGCGCVLYDMNLFRDIPQPWFEDKSMESHVAPGEDIGFCYKLRDRGEKIFVNTRVSIGHLGLVAINRSFYLLTQKLHKLERKEKNNVEQSR